MPNRITQTFIPGPRLIDGSDLNNLVAQANASAAPGAPVTISTVGAGTLTAAAMVSGILNRGGAQSATAFTDTTATATAIVAAGGVVGTSFWLTIENNTNAPETIAAGTGVTLSGNTVIPAFTWAQFLITVVSASAITMAYQVGGDIAPWPPTQFTSLDASVNTTITVGGFCSAQRNNLAISTCQVAGTQLPTPAQVFAGLPNAQAGMSFDVAIRNTGQNTVTLLGLNSTHLSGLTTTIISGVTSTMVVTLNTATDMTVTGMGKSATGS